MHGSFKRGRSPLLIPFLRRAGVGRHKSHYIFQSPFYHYFKRQVKKEFIKNIKISYRLLKNIKPFMQKSLFLLKIGNILIKRACLHI